MLQPGDRDYVCTGGRTIPEGFDLSQFLPESTESNTDEPSSNTNIRGGNKEFNFDYFIGAKPGIVRGRPYNFGGAKFRGVSKGDHSLKDRLMDIPGNPETIILKRPWYNYFCGCIDYCNWSMGNGICRVDSNCKCKGTELPPDGITSSELRHNEAIYYVTSFLNRRHGSTTTQRWRRGCWEHAEAKLRTTWDISRKVKSELEAQEYFNINSVLDKDAEWVLESKTKGRPLSTNVLYLTEEESQERTKLILRYANYKRRRQLYINNNSPVVLVENLLREIYTRVSDLGGVPSRWEYYAENL